MCPSSTLLQRLAPVLMIQSLQLTTCQITISFFFKEYKCKCTAAGTVEEGGAEDDNLAGVAALKDEEEAATSLETPAQHAKMRRVVKTMKHRAVEEMEAKGVLLLDSEKNKALHIFPKVSSS